ncbi:methylenetetrahydrofolate reductase C-terminal domain-containing protein [Trujillonella endophytica]|uniref:Methylene-tetrahydrofolate reductase C terminal n=1 Tax=Trujillonella endophytica TaxID=673521 RepID=A0A1H8WA92_9ACTN|nr:methylenetetrahydrofolate reductase C-terminal domain-containing protein [Trujillella endophytica]SEP24327.1 Methylene-tetrahydrofolate reductase C terminal [Trujillella endophytica]
MPTPLLADLPAREGCPKHMVFGPCGGVRADERCEVAEHRCVFVDEPAMPWPDEPPPAPAPRPGSLLDRAASGPVVLTDLSVVPYDPQSLRRVVDVLAPVSDGLLVGEHANRPDFPPAVVAAEVHAAGGRLWTTLACRDRNRVVLEQEVAGLAALEVDGVLCVTGDARGPGVRSGATQVFDLDGPRLAALATAAGLNVAVPESPAAPPVDLRPARVAQKQRAGAQLCVLNHVRTPAEVARFVAAARAAGATLPFVAGVAVYTDERSARVLQRFPGLYLDDDAVERVLAAADPREAGIAVAVAEARALLAIDGVAGVNLSGLASADGEDEGAQVKAEVAARIRGERTGEESGG